MLRDFHALPFSGLPHPVGYAQPTQAAPSHVTLDSPAADVMTDLTRVAGVIILPGDAIDEAHRRMIQRGVRLLLVVDQDRRLEGAITATDVLGEKPVQVVVARGIRRDEVQVRDIMTPRDRLQTLDMDQVRAVKVGHIVATLQQAGRQHTLVTDRDDRRNLRLRGIFSATQIARQLGVNIQTSVVANTFSEIEAQLVR